MLPASGGNLSGGCNSAGSSTYDLISSGILLEHNFFKIHFIGWSPNIDVYINVRIGEHSLVVVVVNITTINCHLLGWCGCWRPAAHWLCATVAHRPACSRTTSDGARVPGVVCSTVWREPGKHCQNNLGIWCIVWTGKMCVMCSVKCRNSCHPRWRIGSIWRWHPAMSLWHIYYVLFTFYSLEQFYFSSPRHVSIFFFSPPRLDASIYILCIFWSRDASDCPQLQMQCLLMVNILLI